MKYPFHDDAHEKLFEFARDLRQRETLAERELWKHLRNRQLDGVKFRRQHPFGGYIVDFYCHESNLVVEVDGLIHKRGDNPSYDEERTAFLNHQGLRVLRFTNNEVLQKLDYVLRTIQSALTSPLSASETGRG